MSTDDTRPLRDAVRERQAAARPALDLLRKENEIESIGRGFRRRTAAQKRLL